MKTAQCYILKFFYNVLFMFEREREHKWGGAGRETETETENLRQAPGSKP